MNTGSFDIIIPILIISLVVRTIIELINITRKEEFI